MGIATVLETVDNKQVREAPLRLLPIPEVSGPVAMEFKRDSQGRYRFIEANVGRTEHCVDLAVQAGFNLPYLEYCYVTQRPLPTIKDAVECIWFDKGDVAQGFSSMTTAFNHLDDEIV